MDDRGTLVLFPGSLGDFLCLLPALDVIRRSAAQGQIEIVARGALLEVARRLSGVSQEFSLDRGLFAALFSPLGAVSEEAARLFSAVPQIISWFGHSRPEVRATLERFAPGRVRSFAFFTGQEDCHASTYYLRCVGSEELCCPSLTLAEEERQWLNSYWQRRGWRPDSRVLVIHPGSGGKKKRWASEGFAQAARWWKGHKNRRVLILLGPAEEEEENLWRQVGEVEKELSLCQLAALLSRADVYLGNDSGVSHLAGAVGARGVVLFGPTRPQQWRPLGGALSVLHNVQYRTAIPQDSGISLKEIPVEEVIAGLVSHGG